MQTVYLSNFTSAFVLTSSNVLYQINIPNSNTLSSKLQESLKQLQSPPDNSKLVADQQGQLYAVWGGSACPASIQISKFNFDSGSWQSLAQSSELWYQTNQAVWIDRSTNLIMLYGGECHLKPVNRLFTFNLTSSQFGEYPSSGVSAPLDATDPRPMSLASTIALSDYQTLFFGGHYGSAWMSPQQIAIYNKGGWSFHPVHNYTSIDARDSPLILPLFTSNQQTTVSELLVIGGTVAGRFAQPEVLKLQYTPEDGWTLQAYQDLTNAEAYFSVYNTIAVVNEGIASGTNSESLQLYTASSSNSPWSSVQRAEVPEAKTYESKSSTHTTLVAVLSTVLPLIAIIGVVICGYFYWRRRRERKLMRIPNKRSMLRVPSVSSTSTWSLAEDIYTKPQPRQGLRITNPDPSPMD